MADDYVLMKFARGKMRKVPKGKWVDLGDGRAMRVTGSDEKGTLGEIRDKEGKITKGYFMKKSEADKLSMEAVNDVPKPNN